MNQNTILTNLEKYIKRNPLSFHTPGHKNGEVIPDSLKAVWSKVWKYDLTEIEGLDNLHHPIGCIQEAQTKTALLCGAKSSFFLVNGSSGGIHASLLALAYNQEILVPRYVHKSIYSGMVLADSHPIYLPPVYEKNLSLPIGIETGILQKYITENPQCKVIIIPNPTYQGFSYKMAELIATAKKSGLQVIVDEAHGSHFFLDDRLPPSALDLGADVVIQSWHKTLPVLTQASVLHISKDYQGPDISEFIRLLQTTSPSYLLMVSIEACTMFLADKGRELLAQAITNIEVFKKKTKNLKNMLIISHLDNVLIDPLKICIYSESHSGYLMAELLKKKYNIYAELAEESYCLLAAGINITPELLDRLAKALEDIDRIETRGISRKTSSREAQYLPTRAMSLRNAFFEKKERVNLEEALGRICGDYLTKYPPGIPLLVPGEAIDQEAIRLLEKDLIGYNVQGGITVVRE
ncbi:MAG: aminotransferase class I/II-fold pyridoxal phosphate-dependent enzyme [Bacillota bacterium]